MQKMKSKPLQNLEKRRQQIAQSESETPKHDQHSKDTNPTFNKQDKDRTKKDILELRKKMMKSTVKEKKDNFTVD